MSVAEAAATAEAQEAGGKVRSSSLRRIPVIGVVTEDEEAQVWAGVFASGRAEGKLRSRGRGRGLGAAGAEMGPKRHPPGPAGLRFPARSRGLRELRRRREGLAVVNQPAWGLGALWGASFSGSVPPNSKRGFAALFRKV
ncbi:Cilia- and flagella-associated protein 69 [Vulpes lagopus]